MEHRRILNTVFTRGIEGDFDEVVNLKGDRGGWTQGGISSRAHPELASRIETGTLRRDEILDIYFEEYLSKIAGWKRLLHSCPEILTLLYLGKVHGRGINQYTEVIQTWLNAEVGAKLKVDGAWGPLTAKAVLNLSEGDVNSLWMEVSVRSSLLAVQRANSVGSKSLMKGIMNRVHREMDVASVFRGTSITLASLDDMQIQAVDRAVTQHDGLERVRVSATFEIFV